MNLRFFEGETKLLAGKAHSGGVDDGHQLHHVLGEELVEEPLVPVEQVHHVDVLVQRVGEPAEVPHAVLSLLFQVLDSAHTKIARIKCGKR